MNAIVVILESRMPRSAGSTPAYQTLLREELRHMQAVLHVLEKALA